MSIQELTEQERLTLQRLFAVATSRGPAAVEVDRADLRVLLAVLEQRVDRGGPGIAMHGSAPWSHFAHTMTINHTQNCHLRENDDG